MRLTFNNYSRIERVVDLIVSSMPYEEYISLGTYSPRKYFSFRNHLIHSLSFYTLSPRYGYKKSLEVIHKQLEKFRKNKDPDAFESFIYNVRDSLFFMSIEDIWEEKSWNRYFRKEQKKYEKLKVIRLKKRQKNFLSA